MTEPKSNSKPKILKSASQGYGYSFASLADIILQGYELPKMRIRVIEGNDYMEYFADNEWHLGAKIIPLENKKNNAAQNYGAALSYARRYTALMALQLASSDDELIEFDLTNLPEIIESVSTVEELNNIYNTIPTRYKKSVQKEFTKRKQALETKEDLLEKSNQVRTAILSKGH